MWSLEWDWVEENEGVLQRTGLPSLICCMAEQSESEISFFVVISTYLQLH